jgi:hypothetical protein
MDVEENLVTLSESAPDNLETITGIGPTFARALKEVGIYRFGDLAQYTPEKLASVLTQQGNVKIAFERIEANDWIGQAEVLARRTTHQEAASQGIASQELPITTAKKERQAAAEEPNWKQHAGFSLFFDYIDHGFGEPEWQTRLYHEESGRELLLAGTDKDAWTSWIENQANLLTILGTPDAEENGEVEMVTTPATPPTTRAARAFDAKLQILAVELIQGSLAGPAEDRYMEDRYVIEVRFDISGSDAASIVNRQIPYQVEIQTVNLATNSLNQFVELGQLRLQSGITEYTVRQEMPMPDAGRYELQTLVHVDSPAEMMAYYTGPTLNIV